MNTLGSLVLAGFKIKEDLIGTNTITIVHRNKFWHYNPVFHKAGDLLELTAANDPREDVEGYFLTTSRFGVMKSLDANEPLDYNQKFPFVILSEYEYNMYTMMLEHHITLADAVNNLENAKVAALSKIKQFVAKLI